MAAKSLGVAGRHVGLSGGVAMWVVGALAACISAPAALAQSSKNTGPAPTMDEPTSKELLLNEDIINGSGLESALLLAWAPAVARAGGILLETSRAENLAGQAVRYALKLDGHPVLRAQAVAWVSPDGQVVKVFGTEISSAQYSPILPPPVSVPSDGLVLHDTVWVQGEAAMQMAHRIISLNELGVDYERIYGDGIDRRTRLASTGHDVVVPSYNPSPPVVAGQLYGGSIVDNNDSANATLNGLRSFVSLNLDTSGGYFLMQTPYASVREVSQPAVDNYLVPITDSLLPDRSQPLFEALNALHHIGRVRRYLDTTGWNVFKDTIDVDPHALGSADQSMFVPSTTPPRLYFGTGGVDDAEDADVVIHEFGHALSAALAPGTNFGSERNALDEGFGDYLAKAFHRETSQFGWNFVFNWDGHNPFWPGRVAVTSKHYPVDKVGSYHSNGEMWSATMLQLYDQLGRTTLDSILFTAWSLMPSGATMPQVARLMLAVDSMMFGKAHSDTMTLTFKHRGFIPWGAGVTTTDVTGLMQVTGTMDFAQGSAAQLHWNGYRNAHVQLISATGQRVWSHQLAPYSVMDVQGGGLAAGIYILDVRSELGTSTQRLVKIVGR